MYRKEFLLKSGIIAAVALTGEYTREAIVLDPFKDARVDHPTLMEMLISRLTRPAMVRLADGKYTHDPDWTLLSFEPEFEKIKRIWIPGDPSLKPRGHGFWGLIDSISISLRAWPNKIDLVPDRTDLFWRCYFREGIKSVRMCNLAFAGTQSVIQGNESYELFGIYENGEVAILTPSQPKPRSQDSDKTHLI